MIRIVLLVSDLRQSRRFYQGLGFRVVQRHEDGITVALGDQALELRSDASAVAGPQYFTPEIDRFPRGTGVEIGIDAVDLKGQYETARGLDVDIVGTLDSPVGAPGQFRVIDPDGYLLRFVASADTGLLPG